MMHSFIYLIFIKFVSIKDHPVVRAYQEIYILPSCLQFYDNQLKTD